MSAQTTDDRERALAMLKEYLSIGADEKCRSDYVQHSAFMLGSALAMLAHLLGLSSASHPDTARQVFDKWRADRTDSLLAEFRRLCLKASTHFADDSGREWHQGYDAKAQALALFDAHPEMHAQLREAAKGNLWSLEQDRPKQ